MCGRHIISFIFTSDWATTSRSNRKSSTMGKTTGPFPGQIWDVNRVWKQARLQALDRASPAISSCFQSATEASSLYLHTKSQKHESFHTSAPKCQKSLTGNRDNDIKTDILCYRNTLRDQKQQFLTSCFVRFFVFFFPLRTFITPSWKTSKK